MTLTRPSNNVWFLRKGKGISEFRASWRGGNSSRIAHYWIAVINTGLQAGKISATDEDEPFLTAYPSMGDIHRALACTGTMKKAVETALAANVFGQRPEGRC